MEIPDEAVERFAGRIASVAQSINAITAVSDDDVAVEALVGIIKELADTLQSFANTIAGGMFLLWCLTLPVSTFH